MVRALLLVFLIIDTTSLFAEEVLSVAECRSGTRVFSKFVTAQNIFLPELDCPADDFHIKKNTIQESWNQFLGDKSSQSEFIKKSRIDLPLILELNLEASETLENLIIQAGTAENLRTDLTSKKNQSNSKFAFRSFFLKVEQMLKSSDIAVEPPEHYSENRKIFLNDSFGILPEPHPLFIQALLDRLLFSKEILVRKNSLRLLTYFPNTTCSQWGLFPRSSRWLLFIAQKKFEQDDPNSNSAAELKLWTRSPFKTCGHNPNSNVLGGVEDMPEAGFEDHKTYTQFQLLSRRFWQQ